MWYICLHKTQWMKTAAGICKYCRPLIPGTTVKVTEKKLTQTGSLGKYTKTSEKCLTVLQNSKPC